MNQHSKTYGNLTLTSSGWEITSLEPHVSLRLKKLFPKIPVCSTGTFRLINNTDTAADLLWFTSRYTLTITDVDKRLLKRQSVKFYKNQSDAEAIMLPGHSPTKRPGLLKGQEFREYQLTALDLISQVKSLLLIDDIGLGKTYEGLGIALLPKALPLVIVVEPHLQDQWCQKASEFIDLIVHKVKGNTPYDLPPADIYIFKYTQLSPWVDILAQGWIKAIAFDEVQQLRTGTDSAKGLASNAICQKVPIVVGLTATLIYNYGVEAYNIVNIFRPGLLGTRDEFMREWCKGSSNGKGIVKDPNALGAYLRESIMVLRRTKADVGQEAKQGEPHIEWVPPNTQAVEGTQELAQQLAMKVLTSSFTESGQAARDFDLKMREMTGIAKAHQVAAYARMFIETGTPIILFGYHHEVYKIWEEELSDLNPLFYTGRQTQAQKEKNKKAFINGESDLLVMSLRSGAGADGLQHRCSTVIKGEFDWSPKIHEQCIGRVDRDGQEDEVFVFYVATQFGSDPELIDTLGLKESQSRGIVDPGLSLVSKQADTNRLKNLAIKFLKSQGITPPKRAETIQDATIKQLASAL